MNTYCEDFRQNIKYYRDKLGMSQTQLSIQCDCGTGTIGGIESGKAKPSFDMILRIAEALNVTPADLFIRNASVKKSETKEMLKTEFSKILNNL